jgi:hypothetical protein
MTTKPTLIAVVSAPIKEKSVQFSKNARLLQTAKTTSAPTASVDTMMALRRPKRL